MINSLIEWKKFLKFDAGANDTKGTENSGSSLKELVTSQLCRGNRFSQKIVKVRHLLVVDEVAKVPKSMRRQVPMIEEMQKDQKLEEVQISFKVYVDNAKDCQNDTMNCMKVHHTQS